MELHPLHPSVPPLPDLAVDLVLPDTMVPVDKRRHAREGTSVQGGYFGMWRSEGSNKGNWTSGAEPSGVNDYGHARGTLLRQWTCGFFRVTSSTGKTSPATMSAGRNVVIRRQFVPDLDRQTRALMLLLGQLGGLESSHATETANEAGPSCLVGDDCSGQRKAGQLDLGQPFITGPSE